MQQWLQAVQVPACLTVVADEQLLLVMGSVARLAVWYAQVGRNGEALYLHAHDISLLLLVPGAPDLPAVQVVQVCRG